MPEYDTNPDVLDLIKDLMSRIEVLEKSNPLQNANIDSGQGLSVSAGGNVIIENPGVLAFVDPANPTVFRAQFGDYAGTGAHLGLLIHDNAGVARCFIADDQIIYFGNNVFFQPTNSLQLTAGHELDLVGGQGGGDGVYLGSGVGVGLPDCDVYLSLKNTTGSAANLFINASNGLMSRSTSSRKYKQDIEDIEIDPQVVLMLRPRTWRDKNEVKEDPDTEQHYVGFIAEELDELGLSQFVDYLDGEPDAIQYDRLCVALLSVLKNQDERIRALEGE